MIRIFFVLAFLCCAFPAAAGTQTLHALAMNGDAKYGPGFTHFDYTRPDAPKGGQIRLAALGTFDSFNPFIAKGNSADGLGLIFDTLTEHSLDEPFTVYGLVAEKMEVPDDRSWIIFHLRPEAKFQNGTPMTAADVAFSYRALVEKGSPIYTQYYSDVAKVEVLGPKSIKFSFKPGANRELPLILGELPVLSEASWKGKDFAASNLDIPLGSGPYKIASFKAGQQVVLTRNPEYWAKDLPVNKGRYNFDTITYDYYRDLTVTLEAFKAGEYDYRQEFNSKQWATGYTGPAVDGKLIRTENIPHKLSQGMQGFAFNLRRPMFADVRVRQALNLAFDFEWSNKNLFYSQYTRSTSFFSNSEMASSGVPTAEEKALLDPLDLPQAVKTEAFNLPLTDGSGNIRDNLRQAADLLKAAGWSVSDGKLMKDGKPFVFEMLLVQADFERVVLPFQRNLARLGITLNLRMVDSSQYLERLRNFDFDMMVTSFGQSLSPGNEQRSFWSSDTADMPGSRNYCGIKSKAIDTLVDAVINAPDRQSLIIRCKALDRALLWGWYVIPHWHATSWRVASWDMFGRPEKSPQYGLDLQSWWIDADKAKSLAEKRRSLGLK